MNENEKELVKAMSNLVQLDIDTVHAYDQAIKEIDDPIIKERLLTFQEDHRKHISALSKQIKELGGQPPEASKDFKGYVIEAFAAIRSFSGLKGALKSMKTTEEITNRYYGEVVSWKVPPEVKENLRTYFSDEKIHLEYITSNLKVIT
jgi:rubrerythrin